MASVACRDVEDLYRVVSAELGAGAGISAAEISPILQRIKQAGSLVDGYRLVPPAAAATARTAVADSSR